VRCKAGLEDARFGEGAGGGKRVCCLLMVERKKLRVLGEKNDLQGTNLSHLGKRKIIFKYAFSGGYVNFLKGNSAISDVLE